MYQIFISYKKTDLKGELTEDSRIAKELYDYLSAFGLSVFYSSKTLEEIGSSRYKADIDNALDQAKIMIVVLTDANYASAHWVQYEWDSFYNDFLSGVKEDAKLFTLTKGVDIHDLPRTLRNVQSVEYSEGLDRLLNYVKALLPSVFTADPSAEGAKSDEKYTLIAGSEVSKGDISQALELDRMVYPKEYWVDEQTCYSWFEVNPDIYIMIRDNSSGRIIAYINVSPVTDECYEKIKRGDFIDTGIDADMVLSYNMPFPYSIYFSSVVIAPDYQNTEVFMMLFNAIVERFLVLGKQEVYIKRMIADAVSREGEKFCKMFGMKKINATDHQSTLYEVRLIPPAFRVISKKTKRLYDFYQEKYNKEPYLFEE